MTNYLLFLLKSTLCLSLLYLAFSILMRKETFFRLNRMVLLLIVLSSLLIPFLYSPQLIHSIVQVNVEPIFTSNPIVDESVRTTKIPTAIQWSKQSSETIEPATISAETIVLFIYLSGVFVSLLMLFYSIGSVLLLFQKARKTKHHGFQLMIVPDDIPAFSFGRYILISQHDYDTNPEAIITHEQSHIRLGHFYDLLVMELVKIIFWFNPVIYWLIRDMKEIHEFQADDHTLTSGIDVTQYQILIIQKGVGSQRFALANSFNHCQIKKRIIMMNKQKTSKARRWKVATFLPLLALLLMAFGKTGESPAKKEIRNENGSIYQSKLKNDSNTITPEMISVSAEKNSIQKEEQPKQSIEKTVKGKVVDANEKPLEGASVVVLGKTIGTVTDNEGNFILNLSDASPIVVSYIGFTSVKIEPDFKKQMTISLKPANIGIDQVVVVAYGPKQSTELTNKGTINNGAIQQKDEVFTIVEQMPEFPGGSKALRNYIASQIKYPVSAQKDNVQGKVLVSFVINSDGMPSKVTIAKSVYPALDNEAIRVVYSMPKWQPGYQHGKAVDVAYIIPIEFILQSNP